VESLCATVSIAAPRFSTVERSATRNAASLAPSKKEVASSPRPGELPETLRQYS
jgi:hypothetical protein